MQRYIEKFIIEDLTKKMVLLGGPRQVGKTTLSHNIGKYIDNYQYLNWDIIEDREIILKKSWNKSSNLIIFDELHKYKDWKNWLKGVFDGDINKTSKYLVTGSARLDVYKKGGDSMLGRYHYSRLHPITIDELPQGLDLYDGLQRLISIGGFPEPFLENDQRYARRWRKSRFDKILREDIKDLEKVKDIQILELYIKSLRARAGQLITFTNLARDLQISPHTAKDWLNVAENMYICFAIYPWVKNVSRSISKPPKVYFYDNADVDDIPGARLENLVATTLLKRLHFLEDYLGYECKLHYIRDKDGREVDFLTVIDGKIQDLIEVKLSDAKVSSSLKYYKKKLHPKRAIQLVGHGLNKDLEYDGIEVIDVVRYFTKDWAFSVCEHHQPSQL